MNDYERFIACEECPAVLSDDCHFKPDSPECLAKIEGHCRDKEQVLDSPK